MILLVAAAPLETELLRQTIPFRQLCGPTAESLFSISSQDDELILAHCGIGQINMASQLTLLLSHLQADKIILCGCGGAYPHSGLELGDIALATTEILADTGIATKTGFTPFDQLKIPQDQKLAPVFRQSYPLDGQLLNAAHKILGQVAAGPFATVSGCSGDRATSEQLQQRTGAICENMEGAAAAAVCCRRSLPLIEIRGISNFTGSRHKEDWDLPKGVLAAQQGVLKLLQHWTPGLIR